MNIESIVKHLIRIGTVTAIYDDRGSLQVTFFDREEEALELPMFSFINEYDMPYINDTVVCIFVPFFKDGFVIGRFWGMDEHTPKTSLTRNVWNKKLRDNGELSYDRDTKTLTIDVENLVVTGNTTFNKNVEIKGTLHGIGTITSDSDCVSSGKSGKSHTHTDSMGGSTSTPN